MNTERPLRIVQVSGTDAGGSWFFDQVMELKARGHSVHVVVPGEGPLAMQFRAAGLTPTTIPFRGYRPRELPRVLRAQFKLARLLRTIKPDIVHSHLLKAIVLTRLAGIGAGIPVRVSQWPGFVHWDVRWLRWIDLITSRRDTLILGSCRHIRDFYAARVSAATAVSYYGCDTSRFDPQSSPEPFRNEFRLSAQTPTVGMVAHMYPTRIARYREYGVKGHEVFIDAARLVAEEIPEARFFIVGDEFFGTGDYRRSLECRAEQAGLGKVMVFTGHRPDIPHVLAGLDVLVNPSLSESASYTMIEALLMEKGVVASNVGGLPDTVQHTTTGLLVPPSDPESLAQSIMTLLRSPTLRAQMGAAGRQHVINTFDIHRTVAALEKLYYDGLDGIRS